MSADAATFQIMEPTKTFRIHNNRSGETLGDYQAATWRDALDVMARDAGYEDHEHSCDVTGDDPDACGLSVVEVHT